MKHLLALSLAAATAASAAAEDSTGLKLSVAGDIVGTMGAEQKKRLDPREAEFSLYAPVDPWFDAVMTAAAHRENGASFFELHELYVGSTKLIPASRFRLGTFFLGVGRLNQFHRHDWPFISAPAAHEKFFDAEGVSDTGFEYAVLLPLPFYLDLTFGLTNGWTYGHSHVEGQPPLTGTHYVRAATFTSLPADGGLMAGLNYVGRNNTDKGQMHLTGVDLTAKWREGARLVWLMQTENWYRSLKAKNALESQRDFGGYVFNEYDWNFHDLKSGLRLDYLDGLSASTSNFQWALMPQIAWKPSEFSTFRLAYHYQREVLGTNRDTRHVYEIQATFIIGAHPAHDF